MANERHDQEMPHHERRDPAQAPGEGTDQEPLTSSGQATGPGTEHEPGQDSGPSGQESGHASAQGGDGAAEAGAGGEPSGESRGGVGRRGFLVGVGLTGAGGLLGASVTGGAGGAAATAATPAAAAGAGVGKAAHAPRPEQFGGTKQLLVPEMLMLPDGPVRDHAVLVENGKFREIGPARKLLARHSALRPVRLDGHLLMPGFVDAHHHLTQSFGKAQSFGQPSEIFKTVWEPLEHALDEESAYLSAKLAALEALRGGFTTVADAGTRAPVDVGAVAKGTEEAGIRCVLSKIVSDGEGRTRAPRALGRTSADPPLPGHRRARRTRPPR